ncbi:hypothetical protein, partial [Mammaliicoccus sciuri]|uniref:hypothetical protein n=1 Tax=Mammaliicoccus sciuri TaxID=1296 RepID=UPI0031FEDB62
QQFHPDLARVTETMMSFDSTGEGIGTRGIDKFGGDAATEQALAELYNGDDEQTFHKRRCFLIDWEKRVSSCLSSAGRCF